MTEPRYLLDTNILIYLVVDASPALTARAKAAPAGALVTSTLCVAEAVAGDRTDAEMAALDAILAWVPALTFDLASARAYRTLPFKRRRIDRFIGAQACAHHLTIVTNNVADFSDIDGLPIEDWTA